MTFERFSRDCKYRIESNSISLCDDINNEMKFCGGFSCPDYLKFTAIVEACMESIEQYDIEQGSLVEDE